MWIGGFIDWVRRWNNDVEYLLFWHTMVMSMLSENGVRLLLIHVLLNLFCHLYPTFSLCMEPFVFGMYSS